jgi:hypothetical protein
MPNDNVTVAAWPTLKLESENPYPLAVSFNDTPLHVTLCHTVCEPICISSDYKISIDLFGNPLGSITVSGKSRIEPCRDKTPPSAIS